MRGILMGTWRPGDDREAARSMPVRGLDGPGRILLMILVA
jgi:hypothetical protein